MQEWELFSSQRSGLVWPEQPSAALTAICIFKVLFQAPLVSSFSLVCRVYWIWEEVLQHRCCLYIVVQEQQATRSERYTQGFRKEQFSACKDARIGTWKLCRSWRLFGCFCASLLPPSSPPHQGILRLFSLAGLRRIWRSLSIPKLLVSVRVGKEMERTAADFGLSGLWFSCRIWRHRYRVNLELRDARPPGSKWGEKDMFLGRFS